MTRRKLMHIQRAAGLFFILISIFVIIMAQNGTTPIDTDITPIFFFLPVGIVLTFSKKLHINY